MYIKPIIKQGMAAHKAVAGESSCSWGSCSSNHNTATEADAV